MKHNQSGRFASRKTSEEKPLKLDFKTSVITVAAVILLADILGFYPRTEFHYIIHAILYLLMFASMYSLEKFKDNLGERAASRIYYGLAVIYITLACVSGGIASPLKWAPVFTAIFLFITGDLIAGFIICGAVGTAFIKDYAAITPADIFAYGAVLCLGATVYLRGVKKKEPAGDGTLKRIETDKESLHFKNVISGLLDSLFTLYHTILKPVSIMLFIRDDTRGGAFAMTISVSLKENDVMKDYAFEPKDGLLGAALNKNMFFAFDVKGARMPYYSGKVDVKNAAVIPVVLNRVIGAIAIDFDRDIEAEKETIKERLKDLSGEVVSIMELYDINYKAISKEQRVSRMYEINEKLNLLEGKSGLMANFFGEIKSFDIYSGYLAEYNHDDNTFEITESFNYPITVKGTKFTARENEILRYVADSGKPMIIEDASKKNIPLNFKRMNLDKNFISLLKSGENVLGFIKLDKEKECVFSPFEVKTLELMLSRITTMLENAKLYEKIKRQAFHDGLTGLYNHLTFQEKLRESVEKKNKGALQCVSLCVFDIDFFKKFNDSFGHQEGDRVLVKMAGMLTAFEKKYENTYCARYGGEEFVFVFENYDIYAAAKIAEEIREYSEKNLKGGNEKEKRPITLSIGVTSYPEFAKDAREMFKQADDGLYLAKEDGRNKVKTMLDVRKTDRRKR